MPDFGRRVNHDPQNLEYAYPRKRVLALTGDKQSVRHRMDPPHLDQFYTSGCVGFAGAQFLNCRIARRRRTVFNRATGANFRSDYLDNNDGLRNYSESTARDPFSWIYPPDDEGSSALGLMKWWKEIGVISEYRWTFTFDGFLAALQDQPVLVGTNWYDDMMDTDERGIVSSSATGDGGGHEYLANAILWSRRLIGCENSWGEDVFGKRGTFYLPFDLAEELIIHQQGDVAVPILV
jgi:hypothetical protein